MPSRLTTSKKKKKDWGVLKKKIKNKIKTEWLKEDMQLMSFFYCHIPTGCRFWICSALSRKGTQRATLSEGHIQIKTWWKDSEKSTCTEKWDTRFSLVRRCRAHSALLEILHSVFDLWESRLIAQNGQKCELLCDRSWWSPVYSSIIYIAMNFAKCQHD